MEAAIETAKSIGMFLGEIIIVIYVCVQVVRNGMKKQKNNLAKNLMKQNEIDLEIINKMDYAKEVLNADRIHLYEFHNGEHYADYRSVHKFSCSYEVSKAGLPLVRPKCAGLPISVMPRFINKLTTEGVFYCENIEEIKNTMSSTYEFKKALGIESFYDTVIKNDEGNVIGFIAIHWNKNTKPVVNQDEIKKLVWSTEYFIKKAIKLSSR